jgi:hypothetical protein
MWKEITLGAIISAILLRGRTSSAATVPGGASPAPAAPPVATGTLAPAPGGYYGSRFNANAPPGWPLAVGTRRAEEYRRLYDAAYPSYAARARTELTRVGVPQNIIEEAIRVSFPIIYRLGLHESGGQFYRPANSFNDLPEEQRGGVDRISASGTWQFNQGALQRLTRPFSVRGQLVHGPILAVSETERTVHHGSVDAQFIPITHYIALAAWALRNSLDPTYAILIMHSGPAYLSSWSQGTISSHTAERMDRYQREADITRRYLATGDNNLLTSSAR